uniref:GDP-fucose protein O-fucosyltransferase 2 n=2 Tax=Schistosoma mansoni TaxID=6183 RepID=G9HW09_SCHMA|nr:protein O-fucosyltransferase B [Schistosoma mansoni]
MNLSCIILIILACMSRVCIYSKRYLFYDVFYGEGFNLRRDVYIRVANTVRLLRDPSQIPDFALHNINVKNLTGDDWILVLPPWGPLPHWFNDRSYERYTNHSYFNNWSGIPWSMFFDLNSLSLFIPVMDLIEFQRSNVLDSQQSLLNRSSNHLLTVDLALQLVRGDFNRQLEQYSNDNDRKVDFCPFELRKSYRLNDSTLSSSSSSSFSRPMELFEGNSFNLQNGILPMTASAYDCITGDLEPIHLAPFLIQLIQNSKKPITTLYLGSAQSIIHGHWSEWSQEYWTVRRSITIANHLRDIGDNYRETYLHSNDISDRTVSPSIVEHLGPGSNWLRSQWPLSPALGGPYVAVHWRRGDFVTTSTSATTTTTTVTTTSRSPNSVLAAQQILNAVKIFNQYEDHYIDTIYLATDADKKELENLKSLLYPLQIFHFEPTEFEWISYGPGGSAIIDQWICAHARYFIGTSSSTFTFRIIEERSIMGFLSNTTLNNLCPNGPIHLYQPYHYYTDSSTCQSLTEWPVIYEKQYTISSSSSPMTNDKLHLNKYMKDEL